MLAKFFERLQDKLQALEDMCYGICAKEYDAFVRFFDFELKNITKPERNYFGSRESKSSEEARGCRRAHRLLRDLKLIRPINGEWFIEWSHGRKATLTNSGLRQLLGDNMDWLCVYPKEIVSVVYNLWLIRKVFNVVKQNGDVGDLCNPTFSVLLLMDSPRVLADCLYNSLKGQYVTASRSKVSIKIGMEIYNYEVSAAPVYDQHTWELIEMTSPHLGELVSYSGLPVESAHLYVRVI